MIFIILGVCLLVGFWMFTLYACLVCAARADRMDEIAFEKWKSEHAKEK